MRRLFIFVPVSGNLDGIDRGSAVVSMDGDASPTDTITVDFESNRGDYSNVQTFRERLLHAAGRHVERYPTQARLSVSRAALTNVGFADYEDGRLVTFRITDRGALAEWIGDEIQRL